MAKIVKETIHAKGIDIGIYTTNFENEFISLTDIARYKSDDPTAVIQNWMRNRDVIEFRCIFCARALAVQDGTAPRTCRACGVHDHVGRTLTCNRHD